MNDAEDLGLRNRRAVSLPSIPRERVERFRQRVIDEVAKGRRLVTFFGMPEAAGETLLLAVLADDEEGVLAACSTVVGDSYPAITPECPEAHLFERRDVDFDIKVS